MKRITNLLTLWNRPKPQVGVTPADVFWEENKWRLLRYRARPEGISHQTPSSWCLRSSTGTTCST